MVKSVNLTYSNTKTTVVTATVILFLFIALTSFRPAHAQEVPSVGTLRIATHVINDNGGTKQASDFSNCIDSSKEGSSSMQCGSGEDQGISESSFDPGSYKVVADPNSAALGYTVSYSTDCSGILNAGESKMCTITYNDIPPTSQPQ